MTTEEQMRVIHNGKWSMTTEEKMRVIHSWCDEFTIRNTPYGKLYGELWFDGRARITCNYVLRKKVIKEAYYMTMEYVWDMVQ